MFNIPITTDIWGDVRSSYSTAAEQQWIDEALVIGPTSSSDIITY